MPRPNARLLLVALEDRTAPANFHIDNLSLVDGNAQPLSDVPVGEQIVARVDWSLSDMTAGTEYVIRYHFNGQDFDSADIATVDGSSSGWWWYRGLWLAQPGDDHGYGRADLPDRTGRTTLSHLPAVNRTRVKFWPVSPPTGSSTTDVDLGLDTVGYRGNPFLRPTRGTSSGFRTTVPMCQLSRRGWDSVADGSYDRD